MKLEKEAGDELKAIELNVSSVASYLFTSFRYLRHGYVIYQNLLNGNPSY